MTLRIGCVFNPRSGRSAARALFHDFSSSAAEAGLAVEIIEPTTLERIEYRVAQRAPLLDGIIAIGGDGTLNATVNGVHQSARPDLPVGAIAAGRGKDTLRTLPALALRDIASLRAGITAPLQVDLGLVEDIGARSRVFINIAELGVGAAAAAFANRIPRQFGALSYTLGAAVGLMQVRPRPVHMSVDDRSIEIENAIAVIICNGRSFGAGLIIAPMADACDGRLEVVAIRAANLVDLGANLGKLRAGTLVEHPAIERWHGSRIVIHGTALRHAEADGENMDVQHPTFSVLPGALNWIRPV